MPATMMMRQMPHLSLPRALQLPVWAMSGVSVAIAWHAAIPPNQRPISGCSAMPGRKWCLPTRPITCRFPGTWEVSARSSTANSQWLPGKCRKPEFTAFLQSVFGHLATYSVDGAVHFQCMDWRHCQEMLAAGAASYSELKNICVWAKNNGGMGSLYRSQHEFVFVFKSGTAPHINNVELGKHGRYRTNVWSYAGVNSFGAERADLGLHPTVKPVAMVADAIRDCSHRKGIVLDAFVGSGTTLIAAEKTGRRGYGIEIDPAYCDVAIRRLRAVCGLEAVLEATGQRFAEVEAETHSGRVRGCPALACVELYQLHSAPVLLDWSINQLNKPASRAASATRSATQRWCPDSIGKLSAPTAVWQTKKKWSKLPSRRKRSR